MQTTKLYDTHLSYQIPTVSFSLLGKGVLRLKHTLAWHVMQGYCAQQRALEASRLQLFLQGGERVNRTILLYTPVNSVEAGRHKNNLNYVVPAGVHLTLEDLRAMGKLQAKQTDYYCLPRNVLVLQQNDNFQHNAWEATMWLSRPQWRQMRQDLLSLAVRLLMRRGVQSELAEIFVRRLDQAQTSRLQNRLENFHPQKPLFTNLEQLFFLRYGNLVLGAQSPYGILLFRNQVLPGLHESRRLRRRRGKLRGLMLSRGLLELRPRLGGTFSLGERAILVRPQQLPFLNTMVLLSRHALRTEWRRRRGVGLLHRVLRKGGRLFWDLPLVTYSWPLRKHGLHLQQNVMDTVSFPIYSTKGVFPSLPQLSLTRHSLGERREALTRAFPFLFPLESQVAE